MKFSITIPAYKAQFLRECIVSILSQTFVDFELIIVDDNSPQNLDEIVFQLQRKNIFPLKIFHLKVINSHVQTMLKLT